MTDENITRLSLAELRARKNRGEIPSTPDAPEGEDLGDVFWDNAVQVNWSRPSQSVHLRLDADVFEFFKSQGKGHITRMQDVLRAYAQAHRSR